MSVLIDLFRVWAVVATAVAMLALVITTVLPARYEKVLWDAALINQDGFPKVWTYPAAVVGVLLPIVLSFPVAWRLNPTDRDGLPLRQSPIGIVVMLLLSASGVAALIWLPFLYRFQRRTRQRCAVLSAAVAAHDSGSDDGVADMLPLLVLLTDRGWPMSVAEISTRIEGLAADELLLRGSVGPWWPRDREEVAADVAVLVDLGLVEETAGAYAGSQRWRVTPAGEDYVKHSSRQRRIVGGTSTE